VSKYSYLVLLEAEDFIEIEADSREDAERIAIESAYPDWKATIMDQKELPPDYEA
jgi:hypothetical protein